MQYSEIYMVFILTCIKGMEPCSGPICLKWNVSLSLLTLTCTIENLRFQVLIINPYGSIQADCFPPIPYQCDAYYRNGSIRQSINTRETIFQLKGKIDQRVNGEWTCQHGLQRESAKTIVSVFHPQGTAKPQEQSTHGGRISERQYTGTTMTPVESTHGDVISERQKTAAEPIISTDSSNVTITHATEVTEQDFVLIRNSLLGLLLGGVILILVIFVLCNIWISRRCRKVVIEIQTPESQQDENASTNNERERMDIEGSIAHYETINENEMLQNPVQMQLTDFGRQMTIWNNKTETDSTSSSNTTASDILDDEYLHPYTQIVINNQSEIHIYRTVKYTSNKNNSWIRKSDPLVFGNNLIRNINEVNEHEYNKTRGRSPSFKFKKLSLDEKFRKISRSLPLMPHHFKIASVESVIENTDFS